MVYNSKKLQRITHFSGEIISRHNKRQYYVTINPFLIENEFIIVNNEYMLKVFTNNELVTEPFPSFARLKIWKNKKSSSIKKHAYFTIPKSEIDKKNILSYNKYKIEVYIKNSSNSE